MRAWAFVHTNDGTLLRPVGRKYSGVDRCALMHWTCDVASLQRHKNLIFATIILFRIRINLLYRLTHEHTNTPTSDDGPIPCDLPVFREPHWRALHSSRTIPSRPKRGIGRSMHPLSSSKAIAKLLAVPRVSIQLRRARDLQITVGVPVTSLTMTRERHRASGISGSLQSTASTTMRRQASRSRCFLELLFRPVPMEWALEG